MKPDDRNGRLPLLKRPLRVLLIAGSNRRQYNCPGVDSKARTLMLRMADRLPQQWEIDLEGLGNVFGRARFAAHVASRGKVPPGRYRAFGYKAPGHRFRDLRLGWRDVRMRLGMPRKDSSPAKQQDAGLNRDRTLLPKRSTRRQSGRRK